MKLDELEESLKKVRETLLHHSKKRSPSVDEAAAKLDELLLRMRAGGFSHPQFEPLVKGAGDYLELSLSNFKDNSGVELTGRQELALSLETGKIYEILAEWHRALVHYEKTHDLRGMSQTYHNLGMLCADRREWEKAGDYYRKSLELSRDMGDVRLMSMTYLNKAELYLNFSDLQMAGACCGKALEIASELGDELAMADGYKLYGVISRRRGDWDSARRFFEKSIRINRERNCPLDEAETYYEYGLMYRDKGERAEALRLLKRSLAIFERLEAKEDIKRVSEEISAVGGKRG